jgi:hypothetical protein
MIIIKVSFKQDTRRMAVEKLMAYSTLKQLVKNMFPAFQVPAVPELSLTYKDDEGDMVSITTDFELEEAFRQAKGDPQVLRLVAEVALAPSSQAKAIGSSELLPFSVSDWKKDDSPTYPSLAEPIVASPVLPIASQPAPKPAPKPAVIPSPAELPVLQLVEAQLSAAMKAIATFMESLHIDQKMTAVIADIHNNMRKVTSAAQENIINPLSVMTKSKAAVAADHLDKLKLEIAKLKALLEVEFGKAMDKLTQLTSQHQAADVELAEVSRPPNPVSAPVPAAEPSPVPVPSVASVSAEAKPSDDFGAQLVMSDMKCLADMGFTDRTRNLELLAKFNGDMTRVVEILLQ